MSEIRLKDVNVNPISKPRIDPSDRIIGYVFIVHQFRSAGSIPSDLISAERPEVAGSRPWG
jgi:hypothetical protein